MATIANTNEAIAAANDATSIALIKKSPFYLEFIFVVNPLLLYYSIHLRQNTTNQLNFLPVVFPLVDVICNYTVPSPKINQKRGKIACAASCSKTVLSVCLRILTVRFLVAASGSTNNYVYFPQPRKTEAIGERLNRQLRLPRQHAFGGPPLAVA